MATLDDKKEELEKKLEEIQKKHEATLQQDLDKILKQYEPKVGAASPTDKIPPSTLVGARLEGLNVQPPLEKSFPVQGLVNMTGNQDLDEIDRRFIQAFKIDQFFPANRMKYPTIYCETLKEFADAWLKSQNISPQERENQSLGMVKWLEERARKGELTQGVNFPGQGCYLNGWSIFYGKNYSRAKVFEDQELRKRILAVAAHEKLGHGFLGAYSAMGKVKNELGLIQIELANLFGQLPADEPTWQLREEQRQLFLRTSQFLEEGWATWIETFIGNQINAQPDIPEHTLDNVVKAIADLPQGIAESEDVQSLLLASMKILFYDKNSSLAELHAAIKSIEKYGTDLRAYFSDKLGQPLPYAVGFLLFQKAEGNQGMLCMPYTALIAANLSFDPGKIGLTDLAVLMDHDPRLHPDARLAALSQIKLTRPGDVRELAHRAETELSFSVPPELK